jgi:alpha-tubulin suppressor-like RCC1 family protein
MTEPALLDLTPDILTCVCQQLAPPDLVRVAQTCKSFYRGDGGHEMAELPTESPLVTALLKHAFSRPELAPRTRPTGCAESWVTYLARCTQQRRCREAPPIATSTSCSVFADAAGRLLACGEGGGGAAGQDGETAVLVPTLVTGMAGVRVRSIAAGFAHSLALVWDGRVYSWGYNHAGQLGHGDYFARPSPVLVEGLTRVRCIAAGLKNSLAATQSGAVFSWGCTIVNSRESQLEGWEDPTDSPSPTLVEGFGEVRVHHVCAGLSASFAVGEDGELFSWGDGGERLGHGDTQRQPSPKRVEALRGVRVNSVSIADFGHALALAEEAVVYWWSESGCLNAFCKLQGKGGLLPKPVEALRGVRVASVAAAGLHSYAVADTGELWAWGLDGDGLPPLGHNKQMPCPVPKPIAALWGVKVVAVAASESHVLALASDGDVYAWGDAEPAGAGVLGLGLSSMCAALGLVLTPQRVPALQMAACNGDGF